MAAYIIVEVDIHDPEQYKEYVKLTPGTLKPFGGKFIVRGGKAELIEGMQEPKRIVILQFDSVEKAKQWWSSSEYSEAKKLRHRTATSRMIVIEGYDEKL